MTQLVLALAGILLGGGVFAATLFSAAQAARHPGRLRKAHAAAALLTLAAMATLSLALPLPTRVLGALLIPAALAALAFERGWNRLLPAFHAAFGAALLAGLPFAG